MSIPTLAFYISEFNGTEYNGIYPGDFSDYYFTLPPPTPLDNFVKYFYTIVFPYFLLSGTIGNIVGAVIMRRYSHNIWSTCMYMSLVFPMDLIQLYVECGNDWLIKLRPRSPSLSQEILHLSNAVCKVYSFLYNLILCQSGWLTVAIAIETAIAIIKPDWIYKMCTKERASAIVLFICVLLISLNLHFFWTFGLIKPEEDLFINGFYCTYINELSDTFRDYIWPIISVCIEAAIPLLIIVVCIIMSIPSIVKRRKYVREQDKLLEKYFLDVKTLQDLKVATFITCVATVLYIICNITYKALITDIFRMENEQARLTQTFLVILEYVIMSHKFWIYYISCEKFRQDVKGIGVAICSPFKKKNGKTYTQAPTLGYKTQEATVSWQESETETSFSKGAPQAHMLTD